MSDQQRELFPADINAKDGDHPAEIDISCAAKPVWGEIDAADGEEQKIPTFEIVAYTGGKMRPSGFTRDVIVDLAGMEITATMPVLRDHDMGKIVGHGSARIDDGKQILVSGKVSAENEHSREVVSSSKNEFPWQASIGAKAHEYQFYREGESVRVNGQTFEGPVLVATRSTLNETSFVPLGADRRTSAKVAATSAAPKKENHDMKFQEWLTAMGLAHAELTDDQETKLKAKYDAEMEAAKGDGKNLPHTQAFNDEVERVKEERDRVNAISRLGADAIKAYPEQIDDLERLVRSAQRDQTITTKDFELELLKFTKPIGPAHVHTASSSSAEASADVIEAAVCKSIGMQDWDKKFEPKVLEAADRQFRYGIGLQQLLFRAAAQNGQHFDSIGPLKALLRAAFGEGPSHLTASGFSTFSLSGILSNVMNKSLADHFNYVESTWRQVSAVGSVRDFKQHTQYSMTGDLQYQKLGPDGEIKHGTVGEETYTNMADTYARMMAITRKDIINDDLGALQRIPRRMGRGAALAINDVFWTEFLDNSTFFTSARGNFDDGAADTLMDITGLTNAETLFKNLTDPDGKPMGVTPVMVLTPPSLSAKAAALFNSTEVRNTTTSTEYPTSNPHAGKFRPVESVYLSNTSYTGNSSLAWYLLADPMDVPVIEIVFLNGRDMPIVEQAEADFNQLGIQIRGYHDFGVAKQEYRGGVKMKGEA